MNHFVQSQAQAITALGEPAIATLAKRICLIVDLHGRLRILAELDNGHSSSALVSAVNAKLTTIAGKFWSGEIWVQKGKDHPEKKTGPSDAAVFDSAWREAKPIRSGGGLIYLVQRRFSKEGWFDAKSEPPWPLVPGRTAPILSFYSYKGGVGRTTGMASIAIQCARAGKSVVLVDLDLEAPGLASVFPPPAGVRPELGVLDYLLEQPILGADFDPAETVYGFDTKEVIGGGQVRVIPAGHVDGWYLEKLSRLDYHRLSGAEAPIGSPLEELFKWIGRVLAPDLILVDSRAGLHDVGGLALSSVAHSHVLFGLDSEQSWAGLRIAISHLGKQRILAGEKQRECMVVQGQVKSDDREASINRFRRKSHEVFSAEYYDEAGAPNAEWPVEDELAADAPHFPIPLVHDNRVMGYTEIRQIADYLCEGDFRKFAQNALGRVAISL